MAMPEQIRKQAAAVQDLYKQFSEEPANEAQPEAEVTPDTPADDAKENTAPPVVANEQGAAERPHEDSLMHKYKTLQGMYNAEVPRLHAQNKELSARLTQMEQLLASLSHQEAPAAPQKPKLVTQSDIDEYGESIDVMRRVYQEEISDLHNEMSQLKSFIQQMQTNVVPQVQAVAQRQAVSQEQQFWSDLTTAVPNWQAVNNNTDFHSWLLEADPLTGITRQTYLEDAQRAFDVRRVANFFHAWSEATGQTVNAQAPSRKATASELEKQVAPGRSRSAPAPATTQGRTYSPDDIKKFFNDVRAGKFKGREAERDRIERDIFKAQTEGRITI